VTKKGSGHDGPTCLSGTLNVGDINIKQFRLCKDVDGDRELKARLRTRLRFDAPIRTRTVPRRDLHTTWFFCSAISKHAILLS
jgi:hypothetical protein